MESNVNLLHGSKSELFGGLDGLDGCGNYFKGSVLNLFQHFQTLKTQIYHSEDEYLFPLQQSVSVQRQKLIYMRCRDEGQSGSHQKKKI